MTTNTTTLDSITWADMTAAGLDIDRVNKIYGGSTHGSEKDTYEAISTDGLTRVCFAPAEDFEISDDEGDLGWDFCSYTRPTTDEGWDIEVQDHSFDPATVLAFVATWVN